MAMTLICPVEQAMEETAMENKGTSTLNNGLIWFGAGVSIAEILTGTYLAPLGFEKGWQPFCWDI